jgi:antitoxin CcdA
MDINLSAVYEQALTNAVCGKRSELWLAENQAAIQVYNEHVTQYAVFSDGLRDF